MSLNYIIQNQNTKKYLTGFKHTLPSWSSERSVARTYNYIDAVLIQRYFSHIMLTTVKHIIY